MKQVLPPYAQARSDFEIMRGIATRLGVGPAFTEGRDEMAWLRHLYDETRTAITRRGGDMPDFETFWRTGNTPVPQQPLEAHLAGFRRDPEAHKLRTESGRIVLYSETLEKLAYADCPAHPKWIEPPSGSARRHASGCPSIC